MIHYIIEAWLLILSICIYSNLRIFQGRTACIVGKISALLHGKLAFRVCVHEGGYKPLRAHESDGGVDILTPTELTVPAHSSAVVDTLVAVEVPEGYVGFLKSKSGLNVKHNLTGEGVIDSGYTGTIRVKMYNNGDTDYHFEKGDKLIQLVILPCVTAPMVFVDSLEETERGDNGFGSSGK